MNFIQKFNQLYNSIQTNNNMIEDYLAEINSAKDKENEVKSSKQKDKPDVPSKPNAKDLIEKIMNILKENNSLTAKIFETIYSIMSNMKNNLLDEEGKFLKVGVLKWKNIPKYTQFAQFAKESIEELIEDIKN